MNKPHARAHLDGDPLWAVVVVHGVGDTGPGVTLEALLPTLKQRGNRLTEIAQPETRMLPQPEGRVPPKTPAPPRSPASTSGTDLSHRFPVHVRQFEVDAPPDGDPSRAVFAEVYWADLSTAGQGMLRLLLRLLSAIFDLRYVAYVAAVCRDVSLARWLRLFLAAISWLLCGPIAGLTAFVMYLLAVRYTASRVPETWIRTIVPAGHQQAVIAGVALAGVALGIGLVWLRKRFNWSAHWSFVTWVLLAALVDAVFTVALWNTSVAGALAKLVLVDVQAVAASPYSKNVAALLGLSYAVFALVGCLTIVAFVAWIAARVEAAMNGVKKAGPALDAAVAATLLQIGLWVIVVPGVAGVLLKGWSPSLYSGDERLFVSVKSSFAQNVVLAGIVVASGAVVGLWRRWQVRRGSRISRLIVNDVMVGAIYAVSLLGTVAGLVAVFRGTPRFNQLLSPESRDTIVAAALLVIGLVGAWFSKGLGSALHILMDVVGHFYIEPLRPPNPFREPEAFILNDFRIQQRLEARFRAVLDEVLQLGPVRNLTIVAHSQGTMIAIDVLWMEWAARRLEGIDVHLVTMGSPFTHLYQHYFPDRYPPLFDDAGQLNVADWGTYLPRTVRSWINIYRVDDFVGTTIAGDGDAFPKNIRIHPGGHTGYWHDPDAIDAMRAHLPGRQ